MQRIPTVFIAVAAMGCGPQVLAPADDDSTGTTASAPDEGSGGGEPGDGNATPPADEHGDPFGEVEGSESAETGSPGPVCGDGVVDPGEACDDGNARPGDGCEPDCTATPGQLLWSLVVDGGGRDDLALAVAVSQDGEILVVGSMEGEGQAGADVWLRALDTDGATIGESIADLGGAEFGTTIAVAPNGRAFVGGVQSSTERAVLLAYDQDALVPVPGGDFEITPFSALASPTADGFAFVTHAGGFTDLAATLRRFDGDGVLLGDGAIPPGVIVGAAIPNGSGGTILGGGAFGGMGTPSTAWLGGYAADGIEQWDSSITADDGFRLRLRGVAMDGDGRVVGVGTRETGGPDGESEGWVWWWSADGQPDGDGPLDIGGAGARPAAVVVGSHGLVVGGTLTAFDDGFVAGLATDGTLQWGHEVTGDLGLEDRVAALALVPGIGVVAVGDVQQVDTGVDAWIGLFTD